MRQELVARALEGEKKETELQRVKGDNKRLKVALEVKEAELKRAKMDNSCLAADFQDLKAELEEQEAELQRAKMDNRYQAAEFQARLTANSQKVLKQVQLRRACL